MIGDHAIEPNEARLAAAQAAAEDLADRIQVLAERLASEAAANRYSYGPGRLGNALRRRSPAGFHTGARNLQLLLPDGRLWSYRRSDAQRFPDGRLYDARNDYAEYLARTYTAGTAFTFLGAVLPKHTFGFVDPDVSGSSSGLCSLVTQDGPVHFMDPDEAFTDLAESMLDYLRADRA
ncbi:hypothetical protein [Mycolicibacterium sp.]|uniref:hypothetical protein n=1 Tax=Mycolicibacterium sp. TaxID=2320850 RepID=UPI0028A85C6E|nr:hypothetical protein [Mycolicibacterium sp.]